MPRPLRPLRLLWPALAALPLAFARARAHEPPAVPIADLTRLIAVHPDSLPLYLERGELRRVIGDFRGAEDDYREAERLDARDPRLGVCRAALALDTGDPAGAERLLDAALLARGDDSDALKLRARARVALGERVGAIADLAAAIALIEHPSPDLFLERARLQVAEGDRVGARRGLEEARARIGAAASLELFAIELDLADGDPANARATFDALERRYRDRTALAGLDARIAAAGGRREADDVFTGGAGIPPSTVIIARRTPVRPAPASIAAPMGSAQVISRHGLWSYEASGTDLGTAWRQPSYPDSSWPTGTGVLGYGEPFVGTAVPCGPDPSNSYPTTYLRIRFEMPSPLPPIVSLTLSAEYDDGFVVYLNGVEAARRGLASSPGYAALATGHDALGYEEVDMSAARSWLVPGTNVLAVELHQSAPASSDLAWDAELRYADLPHLTRGPYLQMGSDSAITVRWRTSAATSTRVWYGRAPDSLTDALADATLTTEHDIRIVGLDPATRYYYAVGTMNDVIAGDSSYSFCTAPRDGAGASTRAWVLGDSGAPGPTVYAVRDAYAEWNRQTTDLWLMLGDNAYSSGLDSEYQSAVFDAFPIMLRQCVLWPTRGNHDVLHSGPNNDYYEIFTMPGAGEAGGLPSGTEAYYSFNWADTHFICLDSEGSDRSPGGAMLTWLASDLAANLRPWVVAFWHHPPYSKGSHDSDTETVLVEMRQYALPVLEAGGVDLVLCGHSHSYERSFLIDGHYGTSVTLTPDMIVNRGDGCPDGNGAYVKPIEAPSPQAGAVYAVSGSAAHTGGGPLNHPVMVTSLNVAGSMVLDFHGDRLDARFLDQSGAVLDSFAIVKNGITGVADRHTTGVRLGPAMPNPFRRDLSIGYLLERPGRVRLGVYDLSGRKVATLEDGWRAAGAHEARWDGRDGEGRMLPTGVYLAVLETNGERLSRKIAHVH